MTITQLKMTGTQPRDELSACAGQRDERPALVAVLAGGDGRRIGGSKPMRRLRGRPLLGYPVAAARAAGLDVVVVAKRDTAIPELPCETLIEPDRPVHPLCGVIEALKAKARPVLALGCDMPLLAADLLSWLARAPGAAFVELGGQPQPLPARWLPRQLPTLEAALAASASMRSLLASPELRRVDERALERFGDPSLLCLNVNDEDSLGRAERELARAGHPPEQAACHPRERAA